MSVKLLDIKLETCPAARLIGKKYSAPGNWGEWWANGWFDILESLPGLDFNCDGYTGAVHTVDGKPEYWIGMYFPVDIQVPEGFEAVDIPELCYAVCYLYGREDDPELYSEASHNACQEALNGLGLTSRENSWRFERYSCPRFTTPDEYGCVILDYGISVAQQ